MRKSLPFFIFSAVLACVAPPDHEAARPLRDAFPLQEIHVAAGLGEEIAVANADRVALGIMPALVRRVLLTGNAPNRLFAVGERVWVVNSGDNTIRRYHARSLVAETPIHLGVNTNPWELAATEDGERLLVTGFLDDTVRVLDGDGVPLANIVLPIPSGMPSGYRPRPEGIAIWSNRAFVALTGYSFAKGNFDPGALAVLAIGAADPAHWALETTVMLPTNPQALLVLPEAGEIHISCSGVFGKNAGRIVILDAVSLEILTNLPVGGSPYRLAHDPLRGLVYIGGDRRIGTYRVADRLILPPLCEIPDPDSFTPALAYDARHDLVWIADFTGDRVLAVDPADGSIRAELPAGDGPIDLAPVLLE